MSRAPSFRSFIASWRFLGLMALLGLVLALSLSFLTPLQYSSSVRIMITQTNASGIDPYTALKFTERIASSLSELLYSSSFATNILGQAKDFNANYFPQDEYAKRTAWRKAIETTVTPGTGIMLITAYNPNKTQASILADAAARELAIQTPNYFGYNVRVQVIDTPLNSRWFTRPDFLKNGAFGLVIGLLIGCIWVIGKKRKGAPLV
jgi:capsular polysaccharide biosynthesis protein